MKATGKPLCRFSEKNEAVFFLNLSSTDCRSNGAVLELVLNVILSDLSILSLSFKTKT